MWAKSFAVTTAGLGIVLWFLIGIAEVSGDQFEPCPGQCVCLGNAVDCSERKLRNIPDDMPSWTEFLDVSGNEITHLGDDSLKGLQKLIEFDASHNKISTVGDNVFRHTPGIQQINLSHNNLVDVPRISVARSVSAASNLSHLILSHNPLENLDNDALNNAASSLQVLDLGFNRITGIKNGSFPMLNSLRKLLLNDNQIESIIRGTFDNMVSLEVLKLNKNKLRSLPPATFSQLSKLRYLDLSGNQIPRIEGLRFQGLQNLEILRMRRAGIVELNDGAFYGLSAIVSIQLDYNNLTRVHGGFLFGLETLERLSMSHNRITTVEADSWLACKRLSELNLSHNRLPAINESTLARLSSVVVLRMSYNRISYIAENAFRELTALKILELDNNEASGILDDSVGVFASLTSLTQLSLSSNSIKSITKRAFDGLSSLEQLYLLDNDVTSIQDNAFAVLKNLQEIRINTTSLLCDCHLSWLPAWLLTTGFHLVTNARCGHPEVTKGRSVLDLTTEQFSCDDFPKPVITRQPVSQIALKDGSLNLTCQAVTSSDSPLTIIWKKDHTILSRSLSENSERRRTESEGGLMELTSTLRMWPVKAEHAGVYRCIASNAFGTAYSVRAAITISVFPRLVKTPSDSTVKAGTTARLECAAAGQPTPEVGWQKDGGFDFPAARERRMHVMPSDDVFFIVDVKPEDQGVYTCTAKNDAGSVKANATLTVIQAPTFVRTTREKIVREGDTAVLDCMSQSSGSSPTRVEWLKDSRPLPVDSPRHHWAAESQILVVTQAQANDAGTYTCVVSNSVGSERAVSRLTIVSASENRIGVYGNATVTDDSSGYWVRVSLAVAFSVASAVLTSFFWVVGICCIRRRRDASDSSSSSSSTSDTIVAGAGTSSDLSYYTMKLKGSTCSGGCNISPGSSWIYDRNSHMSGAGDTSKMVLSRGRPPPVSARLYTDGISYHCQDSGCYCDDVIAYQQHAPAATLPRASHQPTKRLSLDGSSDISGHRDTTSQRYATFTGAETVMPHDVTVNDVSVRTKETTMCSDISLEASKDVEIVAACGDCIPTDAETVGLLSVTRLQNSSSLDSCIKSSAAAPV